MEIKQLYRYVANRQAGNGLNLIKFHLIDHIADDCLAIGSPANISGGPGETNQKANKTAGKRTQKNIKTFDYEVRIFFPHLGINEDLVCGSTNSCLAPYWNKILKKNLHGCVVCTC